MSDLTKPPPYGYILYLDEAGDPGIRRVRPRDPNGASPWFVLGGVLTQVANESEPVQWVRDIAKQASIKQKHLHFRDLHEWQKPSVCHAISQLPLRIFALTSNKLNMRGHRNVKAEARSQGIPIDQIFYNWCIRVLLERVTGYCHWHSMRRYGEPRYVKIILSERGTHGYARATWYGQMLKEQSQTGSTYLSARTIDHRVFDTRLISVKPYQLDAGLQLADVIASSFYQAVDMLPPTLWNPNNARLLKNRVTNVEDNYENWGLTFLPFKYWEADLRPEQIDLFDHYGFDRFRFIRR
jgi:hypothetical protein